MFDLDRLNKDDVVEGGETSSNSLVQNYIIKSEENREILNLSGGQVFIVANSNDDLPADSSIGNESKDLLGNLVKLLSINIYFHIKFLFFSVDI